MSDVGTGVLAKGRVVPGGCCCVVGFSVCLLWLVRTVVVSTFVECFLVRRCGLVKGCFFR